MIILDTKRFSKLLLNRSSSYVVIYEGDRNNIGKELLRDTDYDDD